MFTAMVPSPTPISRDHNKKLVKIIQALLAYEESNIFRRPIPHKALGWDDYKQIVKKPIDLNYVRRQYNEGKYKFVEEVLDQIQLIWQNVFLYGKKEHESFDPAIKMQKHFDQLLNDFLPEYAAKINRVLYFKQFEQSRPDKKNSASLSQQKFNRRMQKMDIEMAKEQVKPEIMSQAIVSRKKQTFNSRKAPNSIQQTNSISNTIQESKKQAQHKSYQAQHLVEEKKKNSNNLNAQSNIYVEDIKQEKLQQAEHKTLLQNKKQHLIPRKQDQKQQSIFQNASEPIVEEMPQKPQQTPLNKGQNQPQVIPEQQSLKPELPEPIENEDSQQNQFPPILVTLNKTPSSYQIQDLTNMMNLLFEIQQFEAISKVVRILTKYEKENMVIDGQNVNFKMDQIHISTYNRIRKDLEIKFYQLEHREKVKDLESLMAKHNIKSFLMNGNSNQNVNGIHHDLDENLANKVREDDHEVRDMSEQ